MFHRSPRGNVTSSTFGNEGVNVRIPLEVTSEGVKNTNETRSKVFRFIHLSKHAKDNISDGVKKTAKKRTIIKEKMTQFFRDSKNTVSMNAGNKFA